MASLRRLASLDTPPRPGSNPTSRTSRLTRHSSLPNRFLCELELSIGALRKRSCKCARHYFPFRTHSPSFRRLPLCPKLPLCRALSSHSFGEPPHFTTPIAPDACNLFAHSVDARVRCGSQTISRQEAVLAAGKQSFDVEKSIVYTELKESMWQFAAPPRFLNPSDTERNPCRATSAHIHTHILEASEPMKNSDLGRASGGVEASGGVKGRPLSLRMLKRKSSQVTQVTSSMTPYVRSYRSKQLHYKCPSPVESNYGSKPKVLSDGYDSVSTAFASLFYTLKVLQQHLHSLQMQSRTSVFGYDQSCHESLAGRACVDMLDSFLWLFHRVFSCTPSLMLLTIVLLADFTVHSLSLHIAFPVMPSGEPSTSRKFLLDWEKSVVMEDASIDAHNHSCHHGPEEKQKLQVAPSKKRGKITHGAHSRGWRSGGSARARCGDIDADGPCMLHNKSIAQGRSTVYGFNTHNGATFSSPLHQVHEKKSEQLGGCKEIDYDEPTKLLVAPVHAPRLESDNYPCFDRTDLAYQHEIGADPNNPLLLANYAQFLHLVRHDNGRAEELYKRAVSAEVEVDSDVMGRFASFLWVAKGDVAEADRAFKAATVADPANAYHAGNYAHFLWNC